MKADNNKLLLGEILKTFGNKGELVVKIYNQSLENFDLKEPVFITFDGLPVPFFFEKITERGNNRAVVCFDNVETENVAAELVGKQIWIAHKKRINQLEFNIADLVGFKAVDNIENEIGKISEFLDFPNNPCFQIICGAKEIIVPVNENIIDKVDVNSKTVYFTLPEGIFDLYFPKQNK